MQRRVLFIVRDGTLIKAQANPVQTNTFEWLNFLPGVFRNLYFVRKNLDFELVMVLKQDEIINEAQHDTSFVPEINRLHAIMLEILKNEAITFDNILIVSELPNETIKTSLHDETSLNLESLKDRFENYLTEAYDIADSYVISANEADMKISEILGCKGVLLTDSNKQRIYRNSDTDQDINNTAQKKGFYALASWDQIKELLFAGERQATVKRVTNETDIHIQINLDGSGICDITTGIGFFNHLLEQLGKHGGLDLTIKVKGDLLVDEHHTIEDVAIALGEAIHQALGSKRGIERYGYCLPMDECLCSVALDFGGRSWLVWDAEFKREKIGELPTEMISHFFKSFSDAAKMNLHISVKGENEHHKAEGIFKTVAKAIKMAVKRDIYKFDLPSTKGSL